jgi:hypothetical protein
MTTGRIADRLRETRRSILIGRDEQLQMFAAALDAPELPFCVLSLYGPGGIGKTALVQALADLASERQIPVRRLNGNELEASPAGFRQGLERLNPLTAERTVLFIDAFDRLQGLESWLRDVFLPELSTDTLVVLAGRHPLSHPWRDDPAWQPLLRSVGLRNLSESASRRYLTVRGVPERLHDAVLQQTQGYPLALSLCAELVVQGGGFDLTEAPPDIVQTLLEHLCDEAPGPDFRAALEVCSLARVTTQTLLEDVLGRDDCLDLFQWLRSLSFIETLATGLAPTSVARDALRADLRWRSPDRYTDLHRRAQVHYTRQLEAAGERDQQRLLFDYTYLHRDNPVIRSAFTWQEGTSAYPDSAHDQDLEPLAAAVARFEGPDSERLFRYWWRHPAAATTVLRGPGGHAAGFITRLFLDRIPRDDRAVDPAAAAALAYLDQRSVLRSGECALHFRFWMATDTYHSVSPIQSLIMVNIVRDYLTLSGLAESFFPVRDPQRWAPVFAYAELERRVAADFSVDGVSYGVFGHDWRVQPGPIWLSVLGEKELGSTPIVRPSQRPETALLTLSQEQFLDALRAALKNLGRVESLVTNPLLRTRLVVDRERGLQTPLMERAVALQSLIRDAVRGLRGSVRQERAWRALHHTYISPAPSQERAAELLDLPFSTYRRHLAEGIALVGETLWQQELGALLQ